MLYWYWIWKETTPFALLLLLFLHSTIRLTLSSLTLLLSSFSTSVYSSVCLFAACEVCSLKLIPHTIEFPISVEVYLSKSEDRCVVRERVHALLTKGVQLYKCVHLWIISFIFVLHIVFIAYDYIFSKSTFYKFWLRTRRTSSRILIVANIQRLTPTHKFANHVND